MSASTRTAKLMNKRIPVDRERAVKTTLAQWALKMLQGRRLNQQRTQRPKAKREPTSRSGC
jgi:hypothetical protein